MTTQNADNLDNLDEMIKMSQIDFDKLNATTLVKGEKIRHVLTFNNIKRSHPEYSQADICKAMNISVPTMERIRKDLSLPSPYRYSVSDKTPAQREKAAFKQKVYVALKKGLITEDRKITLYEKVNNNLDKSVKDEINSLKDLVNSESSSKSNNDTRKRGGTGIDNEGEINKVVMSSAAVKKLMGNAGNSAMENKVGSTDYINELAKNIKL